jgi:hypothetical protein
MTTTGGTGVYIKNNISSGNDIPSWHRNMHGLLNTQRDKGEVTKGYVSNQRNF